MKVAAARDAGQQFRDFDEDTQSKRWPDSRHTLYERCTTLAHGRSRRNDQYRKKLNMLNTMLNKLKK